MKNPNLYVILFLLIPLSMGYPLQDIGFVIWMPTDFVVEQDPIFFDVDLVFSSPCPVVRGSNQSGSNKEFINCNSIYEEHWYSRTMNIEMPDIENRPNVHHIMKRGVLSSVMNIVTTLPSGFVGGIIGSTITNLVSFAWDRVNPNSDHNRLKETEAKVFNLEGKVAKVLDLQTEFDREVEKVLHNMSIAITENKESIKSLKRTLNDLPWKASFIVHKIMSAGDKLEKIVDRYRRNGELPIRELGQLLNIPELRRMEESVGNFESIIRKNETTINFKFIVRPKDPNTICYEVSGFTHYTGLLSKKPTLVKQIEPEYIIHNSSSNCWRKISKPTRNIIDETCIMNNSNQTLEGSWTPVPLGLDTTRIPYPQDKRTRNYNYVYCYYQKIKIDNKEIDCPPHAFRLPKHATYEGPGLSYKPTFRNMNSRIFDPIAVDWFDTPIVTGAQEIYDSSILMKKIQDLQDERDSNSILHPDFLSKSSTILKNPYVLILIGLIAKTLLDLMTSAIGRCLKRKSKRNSPSVMRFK